MKVILLKNVPKVGSKYDIKNVSDGYALNFLIPHKMAEVATAATVKRVETMKAQDLAEKKVQEELLAKNIETISTTVVTLKEKANDKGHLFSGIHKEQILAALAAQARLTLHPDFLDMPKPIKETGEHKVLVKAGGKSSELRVMVEAA